MIIRACSFCPKFSALYLDKNEVGEKFAYLLKEAASLMQSRFTELSLSSSRNFLQISSKVSLMTVESSLAHFDISSNSISYQASKLIGHFIKATTRLEHLNMASCGLRSSSAREIANALLFNQTVKFLNLSSNNFGSKDHELASKLARII